jgi:small-conductance mechanosensitive channel
MQEPLHNNKHIWRRANEKLLPCAFFIIIGLTLSSIEGGIHNHSLGHKLSALLGVVIFLMFAITFLHVLSNAVKKVIVSNRLGVGRAASLQFILRLFGYLTILFTTLGRVGVPVEHLLLGSAVLGIILGVAAQQALANFFASIVLIISHPFTVGQEITLISGGLGGTYMGKITDIGLTHTRLKDEDGNIMAFPNSALLTGATIRIKARAKPVLDEHVAEAKP